MFTGLVEGLGRVAHVKSATDEGPARLVVELPVSSNRFVLGESIAINGCCLTVAACSVGQVEFDLSRETLELTNLGELGAGSMVNFERALAVGARLGGHLVAGHVDGLAERVFFEQSSTGSTLKVKISRELSRYTVKKGSAVLDGVSLTINNLVDHAHETVLSFMLIPETLERTNLGQAATSWRYNFEADMLAKFVERLQSRRC